MTLLTNHTAHNIAEISGFRRTIPHAFHVAIEPMRFELRQNLVHTRAGKLHLIERLDRGEASGAALIGFAEAVGSIRATGYVLGSHCANSQPAASIQPSPVRHAPRRRLYPAPPGALAARPAPHCPR